METSSKRAWQIRAAVLAIFVLGFAAGALTSRTYFARQAWPSVEARRDRFALMLDRLNLTAEQRGQAEKILQDSRARVIDLRKESEPRLAEVRQQTDERMRAVLTPQQWAQWQQMAGEMRKRRGRGYGAPPGERQ